MRLLAGSIVFAEKGQIVFQLLVELGEGRRLSAILGLFSKQDGCLAVSQASDYFHLLSHPADESIPASFNRFAELRFVRSSGEDGGDEVDSDEEDGPLSLSTVDIEPVKRTKSSKSSELQSLGFLEEDDIVEPDEDN